VRYFQKDITPQSYLTIGLVILAIVFLAVRKRFEKYLEPVFVLYLLMVIALLATVFKVLLQENTTREAFYMGYAFAMIHRLVGFGVIKVKWMVLLYVFSICVKYPLISNPDAVLNIITVLLDVVTVGLSFKNEKVDRSFFDTLYKAKKDIMKFKQLLTQYLPNQMAIFSSELLNVCYINNAFKRTFKSHNTPQVKSAMERLFIEKETLDKNKGLFNSLGYKVGADEVAMSLSKFMGLLSQNADMLRDIGHVSFPVIEEIPNKDESIHVLERIGRETSKEPLQMKEKEESETRTTKRSKTGLKGTREGSEGRREGNHATIDMQNDTLRSSDRGSSKSHSSDMVYEEGRKRVFKVKIFPLLWDDNEAIAMVMDDITQQRIIMELKIADKNKDLVIAMVSHELRTPLNGMLGLLDIAKKNITQPDTLAYLRACRNSGVLLLNLVNSILDINQISHKKLRLAYSRVPIVDFLEEIKSLFDHSCKLRMLYLDTKIDPRVPSCINTDKGRLGQILINLLGNAFKFTFKGGVTIRIDLVSQNPLRIRFSVDDTGIGIKKEDQEKLFKMYGKIEQQDKKINTHGVGLGLTISNTLATLLNPTENKGIQVESEVDVGTSFSFVVESHNPDAAKKQEGDGATFADISSMALNEDKEATILKKVTVYTINNNENFTRMSSSSQNLDSKKFISPIVEPRTLDRNRVKEARDLLLPESQRSLLKTKRTIETFEDVDEVLLKKGESIPKERRYKHIAEDVREEDEIDLDINLELDPDGNKPWCLVVDDNPFNLMVACHIMEERGYRVKTALNGQEAINRAVEQHEEGSAFSIVLMDCQMPVMDGYEATSVLRRMMAAREIEDYPIIALTANNRDDEHEKRCEEAGMNGHVAKPLQVDELEAVLSMVQKARRRQTKSNEE